MSWSGPNSERFAARRLASALVFAAAPGLAAALFAGATLIGAGHARAEGAVPANQTLPRISGITAVGQLLKASHGKWSGSPTSYLYRWRRCNSTGRECRAITGATSRTYLLAGGDVGTTLRVAVAAINLAGRSKPALSPPSALVVSGGLHPPVNLLPPLITGSEQVGKTLTATQGTWTESPTSYAYQWLRCSAAGLSCSSIAGARSSSYTLGEADLAKTLRVSVIGSNSAGESAPARSAATEVVTGSSEAAHLEYVFQPGKVYVYSIDNGFKEVESFSLPDSAGVRGVDVCPAKGTMYVAYGGDGGGNGNGSVLAYDLVGKKLLWNRSYANGIDSGALTLDCSKLFEPTGENTANGVWWVLDTANGAQVAKVETPGSGPHDTVTSADGKLILLGGRNYNHLPVYNAVKGALQVQVGPLAGGVRPLTVNGDDTAVFTIATGLDGFQVSSTLGSAEVVYTENFGGTCGFSTCSHGVSITPDSRELAVVDAAHKAVQFWDVHGVTAGVAPAHLATVVVPGLTGEDSPCAYDCGRDGWVQHSYDGRYVFVGDSGAVIESSTHKVIAHLSALENSRESIEVDWLAGHPIATTGRTGVGRIG